MIGRLSEIIAALAPNFFADVILAAKTDRPLRAARR
jgi:hypothetical protein